MPESGTDSRFKVYPWENDIVIACAFLNADKFDAFSQMTIINDDEVYFIVVSKESQSSVRTCFDMVHELAHILLHLWNGSLEFMPRV